MGIIQLYDRRKYASPVTRIIFKKSIDNYILPKEYKSFDICCIGGGASGEAPFGYTYSTGFSYNGYAWGETYRGYTIGSPGGPGGHVITKKQINLDPETPISVKVGNGGKTSYRSYGDYDVRRNDSVYIKEEASESLISKWRHDRDTINWYDIRSILSSVCNQIGAGEDSFVRNMRTNEILCNAKGGSQTILYNSYPVSGDDNHSYIHTNPARNGFIGNNRNSTLWFYGYGGGNPGGHYCLGYYKGKTKGTYSFNSEQSYYETPYEILRQNNSRGYSLVNRHRETSSWKFQFTYGDCSPDFIELLFNKKDGQNAFGLGLTYIMGDEREKPVAGGGSTVPYIGIFADEPQGKRTDENTDDWKGEDGAGDAPVIEKLVPAGTYLDNPNQIKVISPATPGKPNTGGGGGGGFAINHGAYGTSTSYSITIPPADGGSGCVYIDCYEKDYRPQTRVVGRIIVVE